MSLYTITQKIAKHSYKVLLATTFVIGTVIVSQSAHADASRHIERDTEKLAKTLVTKFWDEVKDQNVRGYSELLAFPFQGENISGHYNRRQQIAGLKGLTLTKFKLKNLIAARYCDTLVISYDFWAKGTGVTSGPSIDIWKQGKRDWKLISHTYVPFQTP